MDRAIASEAQDLRETASMLTLTENILVPETLFLLSTLLTIIQYSAKHPDQYLQPLQDIYVLIISLSPDPIHHFSDMFFIDIKLLFFSFSLACLFFY